jgi:hypothetical protein
MGCFVMGRFVMGRFVMAHLVMGRDGSFHDAYLGRDRSLTMLKRDSSMASS